jgi:hypothetical protein
MPPTLQVCDLDSFKSAIDKFVLSEANSADLYIKPQSNINQSLKNIPSEDASPTFFSLITDRSAETDWDVVLCWEERTVAPAGNWGAQEENGVPM